MPSFPMGRSLWRTLTTGFGPVALAGFLDGMVNACHYFQKKLNTAMCGGLCCCCVGCFCKCIIRVLKAITGVVSRFSLIYCAMFGVPAAEGVKRWMNVSSKKVVSMVVDSTIISSTFRFYSYCATVLAATIAGFVAQKFWEGSAPHFAFAMSFAGAGAASTVFLIGNPLKVISDTLFVGFAEAPQRMETGAKDIYQLFSGKAKAMIDEEIEDSKHPERARDKSCWQRLCCC
jgi:hypothetical protein